jgi:leucyl-tRNA synthetase
MNIGVLAVNPFSGEVVPVWVANYVLMEYGTGAVMSVPAHDERDFEFAQKYSLPVRRVIERISHTQESIAHDPTHEDQSTAMPHAFTDYGILVNSADWSGKLSTDAIRDMASYAKQKGFGEAAVTYRIRDWGISRQRFWGAPVPIIYCDKCGTVPVPEKDLPVRLPDHAEFTGSGESPLAGVAEFVNTICPKCGEPAKRETDTMDTFVDSSWYFFRYTDPRNETMPFDPVIANQWAPVDQYIGGDSHAVMHLIYTRFWTKFMRDIDLVSFDEPVKRLLTQGMVTNRVEGTDDWKAMSKSLGNGVDPDEMIAAFGADAARLFILFAAPVENELRWLETGIEGAVRFLRKVYTMVRLWHQELKNAPTIEPPMQDFMPYASALRRETHRAIQRVTEDYDRLDLNTSISSLMELANAIATFNTAFVVADEIGVRENKEISQPQSVRVTASSARRADLYALKEALESLTLMLAPAAPHISEELWESLGHSGGLISGGARWPTAIEQLARKTELEIPVQVNGKLRSRVLTAAGVTEEELRTAALKDERIRAIIEGCELVKVIVVPQRLVNIVIK